MTDDLLAAAAEITRLRAAVLCGDCPPVGYSTDATRCRSCPRLPSSAQAERAGIVAWLRKDARYSVDTMFGLHRRDVLNNAATAIERGEDRA